MSARPAESDPRVAIDSVRALYAQTLRTIMPAPIAGAITVAVLWPAAHPAALLAWYLVVLALCAARYGLYRRFLREPPELPRAKLWARLFAWTTFGMGVAFGSLAIFFFPPDDPVRQMYIMLLIGTACTAGAAVAHYAPAMVAFVFGLMGSALIRFFAESGLSEPFVVAGVVVILAVVMAFCVGQTRMLRELIETRRRNLDLIDELRQKSELAEAAQRKAEQASLAKSQFFAAASHDLRQPMQALGLFAASLRETKREPEDARRIDQILSSVDALESLFDELLDISKLDAGYVKPVAAHFPAQSLFDRLENAYAPFARKSGLALRFEETRETLHTDSILLERVLANLISNALRYTHAGGVDVRCHANEGRVTIEVADTGQGIPREEHEHVFDEFFQLGNPERDRRKGLGLGLATVRRIAQLIECKVSLESEPGKGSVFSIAVPAGDPAQVAPAAAAPSSEDVDALKGKVIAVVDDEREVRESLMDLLGLWRCKPVVAASARELLAQLDAARTRPDALIADYRLREHESGDTTIAALRARYGAALPALIISGDTTSEIFKVVREQRLPLLSKPVRAARLRAALQHLLNDSRETARIVA
jgi:signal transduction histidine kinase